MRDVFVQETTIRDWDKVLHALPSAYSVRFWEHDFDRGEDVERPCPASTAAIFGRRANGLAGDLLAVTVGGAQFNAHFFEEELIEFDMDPRQFESWSDVAACFEFMAWLERLMDKPVCLSYEGAHETPIAQCARGRIIRFKGWELNA